MRSSPASAANSPESATTCGCGPRALGKKDPAAVIVGRAAARLTWWKDLNVGTVVAAHGGGYPTVKGYEWKQRRIPRDHVVRHDDGSVTTSPALTVLDLIPSLGGKVIDEALRRNAVTLSDLWAAFEATASRPGNALRKKLLDDSRDEPWSESERGFHAIVRGLTLPSAYETNYRVTAGSVIAYLDLAFPALKLAFEVDGYPFHHLPDAFFHDRLRDLELAIADWEVHRVPSDLIGRDPALLGRAVQVITQRRARERGNRATWASGDEGKSAKAAPVGRA